MSHSNGKEI